jgi:RNA-dependent RNA polymerase
MVATNWLLIADCSPKGIFDPDCFKLAQVHSDAVDYPKSGEPVPHGSIPKPTRKIRPDWHAPETVDMTSGKYYESNRAIGRYTYLDFMIAPNSSRASRLFRAITLPALKAVTKTRRRQRERLADSKETTVEDLFYDLNELGPTRSDFDDIQLGVEDYIRRSGFISMDPITMDEAQEAWDLFQTFTSQIHNACISYTLSQSKDAMLTEQELVIGTIVAKSNQPRRRKDMMAKVY